MAKLLQLLSNAFPEPLDGFILSFAQGFGFADIMGQTGLSDVDPVDINAVIIADQDPFPIIHKLVKGLLRSIGVNHEKGKGMIDNCP